MQHIFKIPGTVPANDVKLWLLVRITIKELGVLLRKVEPDYFLPMPIIKYV